MIASKVGLGKEYVYVIRHDKTDFYKIGVSSNLEHRFATLQGATPFNLHLVFALRYGKNRALHVERKLHRLLEYANIGREWFYLPELDGSVEAIAQWLLQIKYNIMSTRTVNGCCYIEIASL